MPPTGQVPDELRLSLAEVKGGVWYETFCEAGSLEVLTADANGSSLRIAGSKKGLMFLAEQLLGLSVTRWVAEEEDPRILAFIDYQPHEPGVWAGVLNADSWSLAIYRKPRPPGPPPEVVVLRLASPGQDLGQFWRPGAAVTGGAESAERHCSVEANLAGILSLADQFFELARRPPGSQVLHRAGSSALGKESKTLHFERL